MPRKKVKWVTIKLLDNRVIWIALEDIKSINKISEINSLDGTQKVGLYSINLTNDITIPQCLLKNDKIYEKLLTLINKV